MARREPGPELAFDVLRAQHDGQPALDRGSALRERLQLLGVDDIESSCDEEPPHPVANGRVVMALDGERAPGEQRAERRRGERCRRDRDEVRRADRAEPSSDRRGVDRRPGRLGGDPQDVHRTPAGADDPVACPTRSSPRTALSSAPRPPRRGADGRAYLRRAISRYDARAYHR